MENASKALLMAAGVLISLMVIGALMFMYNNLSLIPKAQQESKAMDQLRAFNSQYEQYNGKTVYGVDVLSVANKIQDFNQKETENQYGYSLLSGTVEFINNITLDNETGIRARHSTTIQSFTGGVSYELVPTVAGGLLNIREVVGAAENAAAQIQGRYTDSNYPNRKTIQQLRNLYNSRDQLLYRQEIYINYTDESQGLKAQYAPIGITGLTNDREDFEDLTSFISTIKNKRFDCVVTYDNQGRIETINFTEKT